MSFSRIFFLIHCDHSKTRTRYFNNQEHIKYGYNAHGNVEFYGMLIMYSVYFR